ncbi:MAG: hemerythrin domain-containing protein, partial [Flavobacteriales bacterium]|nr:hemerythrin domain-containing protein [Flavobacteriales bacterium]
MKIIDTKTGKRVGQEEKDLKVKLKEEDPILRNVAKEMDQDELSPMDPPDAYNEDRTETVDPELKHPLITQYKEEHVASSEIIDDFEKAINAFKENDYQLTNEINSSFRGFFDFFDSTLLDHNRREERELFPLLHKRLIESGEHSEGEEITTAVDMMEDDHVKFIQLGGLVFNLLSLAARLPDPNSQRFTYDVAY